MPSFFTVHRLDLGCGKADMSIVARRNEARMAQRPTQDARGLPNHFFTDPDHFETEKRLLFQRTWVFAGVTASVAEPGSVFKTEVAGVPVIVVHGDDGTIRAFQNVCPHRGARLVGESRCGARRLTCPYHAWSYHLDGRLAGRPYYDGPTSGVETRGDVRLFPVRLAIWHGAMLVNVDGKAPPLDDHLEALNRESGHYDLSAMRYGGTISSEFRANWKLTAENWLDAYHVFVVHPTLNAMMEPEQRQSALGTGTLVFGEYVSTDAGKDKRGGLPEIPGMPDELRNNSFYGLQFPNWSISIHPTYLALWHWVPLAVDRTRCDVHVYFVGDAATDEAHREDRDALLTYYTDLNQEDENVCRLMQEGRTAPAYDGGRFSPYWDGGTAWLTDLVRDAMH